MKAYTLCNGERDVIAIRENSRGLMIFQELAQAAPLGYLEVSHQDFNATLVRQPQSVEVPIICEVSRVIEFYSR
jgi:hypothetical protein